MKGTASRGSKGSNSAGWKAPQQPPVCLDALEQADAVVICPSNPWVSIGPILAIRGIRPILQEKYVVAVSPIIGGAAVRGPAAKMYTELGIQPSALAVAAQYQGLARGFVLDEVDSELRAGVERYDMCALVTRTLMKTSHDRRRLAEDVLDFIGTQHQ